MIKKTIFFVIQTFLLLTIISCNENDKLLCGFVSNYLDSTSKQHSYYRSNITDEMSKFYFDDEYGEKAKYPNFLEPKPFSTNILFVNDNYEILNLKRLNYEDSYIYYEINIKFCITGEFNGQNVTYEKPKEVVKSYLILENKQKLYIYGDSFLTDIFVFEKDIPILKEQGFIQ